MNKIYIKNKKSNLIFEFVAGNLSYKPNPDSCKLIEVHRPSVYGNPYSHLNNTFAKYKVKTRKEAIENYQKIYFPTIISNIKYIENIFEKYNICLVCWCVPYACHAMVIANYLEIHARKG